MKQSTAFLVSFNLGSMPQESREKYEKFRSNFLLAEDAYVI